MINKDRIVPVTKTDLLSLYYMWAYIVVGNRNWGLRLVEDATPDGEFTMEVSSGQSGYFFNEPVKSVDIENTFASVSQTVKFYFVPSVDFEGFKTAGETVPIDPEESYPIDQVTGSDLWVAAFNEDCTVVYYNHAVDVL